jgi:hypothetical protein
MKLWYWAGEGEVIPAGWTLVCQTSRFGPYGYETLAVRVGLGHIAAFACWLWWELRFPWFLRRQRELWATFRAAKGLVWVGLDQSAVDYGNAVRRAYGHQGPKPLGDRIMEAISYVLGR